MWIRFVVFKVGELRDGRVDEEGGRLEIPYWPAGQRSCRTPPPPRRGRVGKSRPGEATLLFRARTRVPSGPVVNPYGPVTRNPLCGGPGHEHGPDSRVAREGGGFTVCFYTRARSNSDYKKKKNKKIRVRPSWKPVFGPIEFVDRPHDVSPQSRKRPVGRSRGRLPFSNSTVAGPDLPGRGDRIADQTRAYKTMDGPRPVHTRARLARHTGHTRAFPVTTTVYPHRGGSTSGGDRSSTHLFGHARATCHHVQRENVYAVGGGVLHVGDDGPVPSARVRRLPGVRLATRLRHEPSKPATRHDEWMGSGVRRRSSVFISVT